MVQRREYFGFALKPCESVSVECEWSGQNLDGDLPLQLLISGAIDLAHAANADLGSGLIRAEAGASSQAHK